MPILPPEADRSGWSHCREFLVALPSAPQYGSPEALQQVERYITERFPAFHFEVTAKSPWRYPNTHVVIPVLGSIQTNRGSRLLSRPPQRTMAEIVAALDAFSILDTRPEENVVLLAG